MAEARSLRSIQESIGSIEIESNDSIEYIGSNDSVEYYVSKDIVLTRDADSLIERNPSVADWVNSGRPLEDAVVFNTLNSIIAEVSTPESAILNTHPTTKKEKLAYGRYKRFVIDLCREIKDDFKKANGRDTRRIIRTAWPWVLNKIAGNEDLRDKLSTKEEVQETALKTFVLYFSHQHEQNIERVRRYQTDKEALN